MKLVVQVPAPRELTNSLDGDDRGSVWAEVENGTPVHPHHLLERVRFLIANNVPFRTYSDTVISMIGWMIRVKEIESAHFIVSSTPDGQVRNVQMDIHGEFVQPWPEEGMDSIVDAGFYYRFSGDFRYKGSV